MGALAISQLSSQSTVNRWREAKSREPAEFMSPSHQREYSLLGEHCSVVRLNEGSILYALRGWINAQSRRACVWASVSNVRLSLNRSSCLSSLTHRGCQFESDFEPLALPPVCSQSAV